MKNYNQDLTLELFIYLFLIGFLISTNSYSQGVGINASGNAPNSKALLDVDAAGMNPKAGLLMPRITTAERDAITAPIPESLIIYNTTTKCFEAYVNGAWNTVSCPSACTPPTAPVATNASSITCNSFKANWNASTGATSYLLDVATNSGFTSYVAGYNNLNVGNVTSYNITGLTTGTTYYYRVRAVTTCISGNSNTKSAVPVASTASITGGGAVCNGGYITLTASTGISYSWSTGATTASVSVNPSSATTYYVTVTTSAGCTATANAGVTVQTTVTDIVGTSYNVVGIGNQCWMKENLRTTKYRNGTAIAIITTDNTAWENDVTGAWCYYNNSSSNVGTYGRIYNWYAVNNSNGLCPTGWHVPTHDEWTTLERYLCASSTCSTDFPFDNTTTGYCGTDEGGKLKETGTTNWASPNTGATNSSNFTGRPGGYRKYDGSFLYMTTIGYFWSSTNIDTYHAWGRYLQNTNSTVMRWNFEKGNGFSVRCVKD